MPTRREARERALSLAYECEQRESTVDDLLADLPVDPDPYAVRLVRGVADHHDEIDALLRKYSEHWALERMPVVDRALLRLGTFELAKQYSTKDSGRFVNALLSRIAEEVRP